MLDGRLPLTNLPLRPAAWGRSFFNVRSWEGSGVMGDFLARQQHSSSLQTSIAAAISLCISMKVPTREVFDALCVFLAAKEQLCPVPPNSPRFRQCRASMVTYSPACLQGAPRHWSEFHESLLPLFLKPFVRIITSRDKGLWFFFVFFFFSLVFCFSSERSEDLLQQPKALITHL